jgi:hypothetical protein
MDNFTDIDFLDPTRLLIPMPDASQPDGEDDMKYLANSDSRQYWYPGYCVVA